MTYITVYVCGFLGALVTILGMVSGPPSRLAPVATLLWIAVAMIWVRIAQIREAR